jgi:HK97 family phage major capsid protein
MDMEKLLAEMAAIKASLAGGFISKESYDNAMKELNAKFIQMEAQMKQLDEIIKLRANAMNGLENSKEGKNFSMGKLICGLMLGKWANKNGVFSKAEDSAEYNIVKEYTEIIGKANEHTTTGGSGGYSVPPQAIMTFIEKLYANLVVKRAGARLMTGLTGGTVYIPRQSGSVTASWIGEGSTISNSKITDQQITMTPKECAALVTINNKLLALAASNPSIESLILGDMEMQIQLAVDYAALRGAGGANEPQGIANVSGISTLALGDNGDYFDFDDVIDMEGKLDDENALKGKTAFITHGKIKRRLRKTKVAQFSGDTAGAYVVKSLSDPDLTAELGHQMLTTSQIPTNLEKGSSGAICSEVYFGNWDDLIIGQWGGLDIAKSDSAGTAFEENRSKIRMIQMVDVKPRHEKSFCLCNDAKTV